MRPTVEEPRLFRGPPAAVHLIAHHHLDRGWDVTWVVRREGEGWDEANPEQYSPLTTGELVDVVSSLLDAL